MNNQYDANLIFQFLIHTPESALKKMFCTGSFTDVHFNMLMKIVRAGNETDFCDHFYKTDFPKSKFNAKEIGLKETFWITSHIVFNQHGLLQPASHKVAA